MYIKIEDGIPKACTTLQLRRDNPQVSFPKHIPDETLAKFGVYPVKQTPAPDFDQMTHRREEGEPALVDGEWVQVWSVIALSADEMAAKQAARAERMRDQRAAAYREEADPLFFKAQRGEATMDQWRAKVDEIKARYPE